MRCLEQSCGARRYLGIALCSVSIAFTMPGCSSAYDKTLHQMALPADELLAVRVAEMMECADHAIQSLEDARAWYTSVQGRAPDPPDARLSILANDAEAGAFEFSRRVLSVEDVAGAPGSEGAVSVERLRASMAACRQSLNAAAASVRSWVDGHGAVAADVGIVEEPSNVTVDRAVGVAQADVDTLRADAALLLGK